MATAKIHFSDKSTLELHENDFITPITLFSLSGKEEHASKSKPVDLYEHIHYGLIPSIMDALCGCNFFQIGDNSDVVYSSHSIVRIENC